MSLLGVNSVAVGLLGGGLCSVGRTLGEGQISSQIKKIDRILRGLQRGFFVLVSEVNISTGHSPLTFPDRIANRPTPVRFRPRSPFLKAP